MPLVGLTEQGTLSEKLRAPLSQAGLKLLHLKGKKIVYLYSPTFHIFCFISGVLWLFICLGGEQVFGYVFSKLLWVKLQKE